MHPFSHEEENDEYPLHEFESQKNDVSHEDESLDELMEEDYPTIDLDLG